MRIKGIMFSLLCLAIINCGPDTIFVRPGLDTPEQHVVVGNQLLERGKVEDAYREFSRARELNPHFIKAYIGLGIAMAQKGEIEKGMLFLDQAKQMADTSETLKEVQKGYLQIEEIKRHQMGLDSP